MDLGALFPGYGHGGAAPQGGGAVGAGGLGGGFNAAGLNEGGQTLRFSNFLITISTNVHPLDDTERNHISTWLVNRTQELFNNWDRFNGTVIKPAGTLNGQELRFPDNHRIVAVSSNVAIEEGDFRGHAGQIHAHVLLEIAHCYDRQEHGAAGWGTDQPDREYKGVHVNVRTLRRYLNGLIGVMGIHLNRHPRKIYLHCQLLTKGTDNSSKWLTLAYIDKQNAKDNGGGVRNLAADRAADDPELQALRGPLRQTPYQHRLQPGGDCGPPGGAGGALDAGDPFGWDAPPAQPPGPPPGWQPAPDPTFQRMGAARPPEAPAPAPAPPPPAPVVKARPMPKLPPAKDVPRPPMVVPGFKSVTSVAKIGSRQRVTRGRKPSKYR